MSLDEVLVEKSSFSFQCWYLKITEAMNLSDLCMEMKDEKEHFSIDPEQPGFHDCECNDDLIKGYYSVVVPFEVESLVDGITSKSLHKRIETCEFWLVNGVMFAWGKSSAQKNLSRALTPIVGFGVVKSEFDCNMMQDFQERLNQVRSLDIQNPKEKEITKAKISGRNIEDYSEIADPRNHMISKVSGLLDTANGPLTVSVSNKGLVRLNVRRGFVMSFDLALWLWSLIRSEGNNDPLKKAVMKLLPSKENGLTRVEFSTPTTTVSITREEADAIREREEPSPYHGNNQEDCGS